MVTSREAVAAVRAWVRAAGALCAALAAGCAPITPPGPSPGGAYLIVAMGDSYASGQGAPDENINWWTLRFHPRWDNKRCNRSLNAGTRKALDFLTEDPAFAGHTFEYQSFACSGASIETGVLGPHRGPEPDPNDPQEFLEPQIEAVGALAQSRTIDALTITVGGNDILFQHVVAACLLGSGHCNIVDPIIVDRLATLRSRLQLMADAFQSVSIAPDRIFLIEYPDPTHETGTTLCDRKPRDDLLRGISACEARWASECVIPKLNHELCRIAQQEGWNYVGGLAAGFGSHGWCSGDNWINLIKDSLRNQGHYRGGVHPNQKGYEKVGSQLAGALKMKLLGSGPPPTACPAYSPNPICDQPCGANFPMP